MSREIVIIPVIDHESYMINGKQIFKEGNDKYICRTELTHQEQQAWTRYYNQVINNVRFKKHCKATY